MTLEASTLAARPESQSDERPDPALVWPLGSRVNELGRLEVGGCDVVELAREFGTPAYVVAEDDIRARARAYVSALRSRQPAGEVLFASKAMPCSGIERILAQEGLGCDVASGGELQVALRAGFDPARIYLHGNAKSERELAEALDAGIGVVVVDHLGDVERLERLVASGCRQPVLLRVTPDIRGETHGAISTGQADSKFGVGLPDAPAALARISRSSRLELLGLHLHIGSQLFRLDLFRAAVEAIAGLGEFPVYDLGGGLAVAYTSADRPPSIDDYVAAKVSAAQEFLAGFKRLVLEPGRSLVANAGVTLYTVESVKRNVSTWVAVDGGMADNLRPMLYDAPYEARIADRFAPGSPCRLVGKHCESGDVLVREASLPDPHPGDLVVTPATGAYGHAMANNYNGLLRPPIVLCRDGDARVVVRRESYADLLARDVG